MDDGDAYSQIKDNLQQRLLSAVKQCQQYYGTNDDVGTEGDMRVSTLCTEWESVLVHGIKKNKNKLRGFNKLDQLSGVSIWSIVSPLLSDEESRRFIKLKHTNTDIGRGRAWLRAALNERTLENYLHLLLSNRPHLINYYEKHAFIMDEERNAMLPTMAAGLGSIIFSLSIDSDCLNSPLKTTDVLSHVPLLTNTSTHISEAPPPFIEALSTTKMDFNSRFSNVLLDNDNDCVVEKKEKKKKNKKVKSSSPQFINRQSTNHITIPSTTSITTPTYDTSLKDTPIHSTIDSSNHDNLNPFNDSLSIASSVSSLGDNTLLFNAPSDPCIINKDSIMMDSQIAIDSTSMVIAATGEQQQRTLTEQEKGSMSMTSEEMREALKVLIRNKEETEEMKNKLENELIEQKSHNESLRIQLIKSKEEYDNTRETYGHQTHGLERENDLLREQLKRHIGLVKQQQQQQDVDQKDFTSTKLSEMAEMYGELMEFNDRLHKDVYTKNNIITTLCHSLLSAGLELPVSSDQLPHEALRPKRVVDIWVPSVIWREKGHHVYQIYLSLGNEEWNVYRRFAEFYEFHQQMIKSIEGIEDYPFPPKKAIGSKTVHVVEERRSRLQDYLRFVIDVCSSPSVKRKDGRVTKSVLDYKTTKEDFVRIFPFFKTDTTPIINTTSTTRPPLTKSPSYNGL